MIAENHISNGMGYYVNGETGVPVTSSAARGAILQALCDAHSGWCTTQSPSFWQQLLNTAGPLLGMIGMGEGAEDPEEEPGISGVGTSGLSIDAAAAGQSASRLPDFTASASSLQKTYSQHAADFGFFENWNRGTAGPFEQSLQDFIDSHGTMRFTGTYRRNPLIFNVDPSTGLTVLQSPTGGLISGWQLNPQQLWNVMNRGSL
jgi:hypothetical protein